MVFSTIVQGGISYLKIAKAS